MSSIFTKAHVDAVNRPRNVINHFDASYTIHLAPLKSPPGLALKNTSNLLPDHPDVDELYKRVSNIDPKISIATVYRTVKLFAEVGIVTKHGFKGGKARYEELSEGHHDHLIDIKTGEIVEFVDEEIEKLQKKNSRKVWI